MPNKKLAEWKSLVYLGLYDGLTLTKIEIESAFDLDKYLVTGYHDITFYDIYKNLYYQGLDLKVFDNKIEFMYNEFNNGKSIGVIMTITKEDFLQRYIGIKTL